MTTIFVLNGPNLNLLGAREPEIYGRATLADLETLCRSEAEALGFGLFFGQSNAEHEIIGWIHEAIAGAAGIVINPAAFSYASYAIYDALLAFPGPAIEVHLSNIARRAEPWRARSLISGAVTGTISGLGPDGYRLALRQLARRLGAGGGE